MGQRSYDLFKDDDYNSHAPQPDQSSNLLGIKLFALVVLGSILIGGLLGAVIYYFGTDNLTRQEMMKSGIEGAKW